MKSTSHQTQHTPTQPCAAMQIAQTTSTQPSTRPLNGTNPMAAYGSRRQSQSATIQSTTQQSMSHGMKRIMMMTGCAESELMMGLFTHHGAMLPES